MMGTIPKKLQSINHKNKAEILIYQDESRLKSRMMILPTKTLRLKPRRPHTQISKLNIY